MKAATANNWPVRVWPSDKRKISRIRPIRLIRFQSARCVGSFLLYEPLKRARVQVRSSGDVPATQNAKARDRWTVEEYRTDRLHNSSIEDRRQLRGCPTDADQADAVKTSLR